MMTPKVPEIVVLSHKATTDPTLIGHNIYSDLKMLNTFSEEARVPMYIGFVTIRPGDQMDSYIYEEMYR